MYDGAMGTAATETRILDAAQRLVQTRGYNGFSYADIAAELRIRNASIHYHFPSKSELGRRLVARYREGFLEALRGLERRSGDARRRLRAYVEIWTRVLKDGDRMCLCGMMAAESATLPRPVRAELRRFFDENELWLTRVLDEGRRSGALRLAAPPKTEARLLTMGLEGAMLLSRSYGDPARFEAIAARLLAAVGA
jgi:TetR/AcrR family transcriptional regulator, transcriptional repressor for nem operon